MPFRQFALLGLIATFALPGHLVAQADTAATELPVVCPDSLSGRGLRVCQAALDGAVMLHPFAALLMNGGNPRLGSAAPIGKFGHFALTIRATTATGVIPDLTYDGTADTVAVGQRVQFYAPHVDLDLGLVQMVMPMGTIGVDVMLSALVIPSNRTTAFTPVPGSRTIGKAAVTLDWGVRFGMTSPTLPTVSLTIMKRSTPTVQLGGTTDGNTTAYTFNASSIDVRLFAGKRFDWLELAAGAGVDLLSGSGEVAYRDPETDTVGTPLEPKLSGMRIVTAMDVGVHLGPLELVVEGGFQVGSNLALTTRFAEVNPNAGRFFGSFGVVLTR